MDENTRKYIAAQLRRPAGETAAQVGEKMNEGNRLLNFRAIRQLAVQPGDRILEIGMGNGAFVPLLLAAGPSVSYVGCDYSPEMVQQATLRNQAAVANGQARFLVAEASSLPFSAGQFDRILAVNTLYFWEHPEEILAGLHRLLKPAGTLLVGLRPKTTMQHYPFVSHGFRLYDAAEVTALLAASGFRVVRVVEEPEPDQEFNGQAQRVDSLLVVGQKPD